MKLCPTCGEQFPASATHCTKDQTTLVEVREPQRDDSLLGRTLDKRYLIQARLGAGGMGTVYAAQQTTVGRKVAIKVLLEAIANDLGAVKRFMQEARAASAISHPNAITVHDFGQSGDGLLYLVMEYVEGRTLSSIVKQDGALTPERAVSIVFQILNALEDAHGRGIVHRDLKPENVIISPRPGNPDFAKVLDFGLAKIADDTSGEGLTKTGQIFGTPAYMSPEQARGERCDARTDLYSVGIILYELLSGRRPFEGDSPISILVKHINEAPPAFDALSPPAFVPPELSGVVARALVKERHTRFASAAEMRDALLQAADAAFGGHFAPGSVPRITAPPRTSDPGLEGTLDPSSLPPASVKSLRALALPSAPPAAGPSTPSAVVGQLEADARRPSGRRRLSIAVAAVALVGTGVFFALRPASVETQPAVAMPPSPVRTALLHIEGSPPTSRATVVIEIDGRAEPPRSIGLPGALDVPIGARCKVDVTAPDHQAGQRELTVEGPSTLHIELAPVAPPSQPPSALLSTPPSAPPSVAASSAPPPPLPASRRPGPGPKPASAPATQAPAPATAAPRPPAPATEPVLDDLR